MKLSWLRLTSTKYFIQPICDSNYLDRILWWKIVFFFYCIHHSFSTQNNDILHVFIQEITFEMCNGSLPFSVYEKCYWHWNRTFRNFKFFFNSQRVYIFLWLQNRIRMLGKLHLYKNLIYVHYCNSTCNCSNWDIELQNHH